MLRKPVENKSLESEKKWKSKIGCYIVGRKDVSGDVLGIIVHGRSPVRWSSQMQKAANTSFCNVLRRAENRTQWKYYINFTLSHGETRRESEKEGRKYWTYSSPVSPCIPADYLVFWQRYNQYIVFWKVLYPFVFVFQTVCARITYSLQQYFQPKL